MHLNRTSKNRPGGEVPQSPDASVKRELHLLECGFQICTSSVGSGSRNCTNRPLRRRRPSSHHTSRTTSFCYFLICILANFQFRTQKPKPTDDEFPTRARSPLPRLHLAVTFAHTQFVLPPFTSAPAHHLSHRMCIPAKPSEQELKF